MAVRLLREHPSVRAALSLRYRYLLVDEFQDTNPAQLDLLDLVGAGTRNVTVVGDDDQAIYAFRGAAVENLLGFEARFPGTRTIALRRNHRSRRPIVEAARRLIQHNDPIDLRLALARPDADRHPPSATHAGHRAHFRDRLRGGRLDRRRGGSRIGAASIHGTSPCWCAPTLMPSRSCAA